MKILLTGADGQLGKETKKFFVDKGRVVFSFNKKQLDITDHLQVREAISIYKPDVIINAAAFTKVDLCEIEHEKAYLINAIGPFYLAKEAKRVNCKFFHISTDYVFSGNKNSPYEETDLTAPNTIYGKSKRAGEELVLAINNESTIIRTSWLYGHEGNNFVKTIAELSNTLEEIRVVNDQIGSPTYTKDLVMTLNALMNEPPGVYHVSNKGSCSWYEFASEIISILNRKSIVIPVTSEQYGLKTPRPMYSVLSNKKITELQITQRDWKKALHEFLREEYLRNGN